MKTQTKPLRQLAKELGVSVSYLSQIKNGKRPASQKVLSKVLSNNVVANQVEKVKQFEKIRTKSAAALESTGQRKCGGDGGESNSQNYTQNA